MKLVIKTRAVLTPDPSTQALVQLDDHALVVENGVIRQLAPTTEVLAGLEGTSDVEVRDFSHHVAVPGFVNAHHHVGLSPFQLGVPDSPLEPWIAAQLGEPALDMRLDTLYSAVQMLRSGVTTVQHVQVWYPSDAIDLSIGATSVLDAYAETGMRASFSKMIRDQNFFVHDDDTVLAPDLPPQHRDAFLGQLKGLGVGVAEQLDLFTHLREKYASEDRLAVQLAPANLHWLSDTGLEVVAGTAADTGVCLHMHLLETVYQHRYLQRRTGGEGLAWFERFGLLSDRLTLGHGTWLEPRDIEVLAGHDVRVCHNCSSNFRLSSGSAPVNDLLAAGVRMAVGIDEAGVNDDHDMLQELRMVFATNREAGITGRRVTAAQVLRMATLDGASTTPFGAITGALEVGRAADLVLLDHDRLTFPFQLPGVSLEELVVQRSRVDAVTDVLIGGEWVVRDSRVTTIDEDALLAQIADMRAAVDLDDLARRQGYAASVERAVGDWFPRAYGI